MIPLQHTRSASKTSHFAGLIGRDVDTGQLLARLAYEAYDEKGEPIPGGSGMLTKEGLTDPIFTPQAEKIKVVSHGVRSIIVP